MTLLLYYKVVFLDLCLEYTHKNGMTFSPDLELKNSFCLALFSFFQEMAEKFGKMNCKTIIYIVRNKVLIHFSLYKFRKHNAVVKTSYNTLKI